MQHSSINLYNLKNNHQQGMISYQSKEGKPLPPISLISIIIAMLIILYLFIYGIINNTVDVFVPALILAVGVAIFAIIDAKKGK